MAHRVKEIFLEHGCLDNRAYVICECGYYAQIVKGVAEFKVGKEFLHP
jgi:hypothetical protein